MKEGRFVHSKYSQDAQRFEVKHEDEYGYSVWLMTVQGPITAWFPKTEYVEVKV